MAKVELKQPIVDQIAEEIKDAQSVVLVDHRGLTVAQDTELRKQLREAGVVYKVYKNTMMKRAFEGTDFAALDGCLEGPSAIAISKDDATAPARILYKFAQDAPALELKGGVVEGTAYDVAGISELAVTYYKLCSCYQSDRRAGWRSRSCRGSSSRGDSRDTCRVICMESCTGDRQQDERKLTKIKKIKLRKYGGYLKWLN